MTYSTNYSVVPLEFYNGTNRPKKPIGLPSGEVEVLSEGGLCEAIWQENRCCMLGPRAGAMGDGFVDTYNKLPIHVTHILKPVPNSIIFTKEELEARDRERDRERDRRVAAEAWDDGAFYGNLYRSDYRAFKGKDISRNNKDLKEAKEQYINSLKL